MTAQSATAAAVCSYSGLGIDAPQAKDALAVLRAQIAIAEAAIDPLDSLQEISRCTLEKLYLMQLIIRVNENVVNLESL